MRTQKCQMVKNTASRSLEEDDSCSCKSQFDTFAKII